MTVRVLNVIGRNNRVDFHRAAAFLAREAGFELARHGCLSNGEGFPPVGEQSKNQERGKKNFPNNPHRDRTAFLNCIGYRRIREKFIP